MALPDPTCFLGLPPDERMLAIFEAVVEGGGGGETTIYASRIGAALDGVTDDTQILQGALDGGDVHLIVDGPSLWDTLYLESNTTLELQEYTYTKKPAPNSGTAFIRNKNVVAYPESPVDDNIIILAAGAVLDGNRRNGGGGNPPGTGPIPAPDEAYNVFVNTEAELTSTIQMFGVTNLSITGGVGNPFTIHDSPAFGIHFANVQNGVVRYYDKTVPAGDEVPVNDGWHINGGCVNCVVENANIATNDDMVGICADDGDDLPPGTQPFTFPPGVASGPIINCHGRHLVLTVGISNSGVGRFLSASRDHYIQDCSIEDVDALFTVIKPIYFDNFGVVGLGDYRSITLSGMKHECPAGQVHIKNGFVRRLIVDGSVTTGASDALVSLQEEENSICVELEIKNCTTAATDYLVSVSNGSVLNTLFRSGNVQVGGLGEIFGSAPNNASEGALPDSETFFSDLLNGASGASIVGRVPSVGLPWTNDAEDSYPGSDIRMDGSGETYNGLGASGSSLTLTPTPVSGNAFSMMGSFRFLTLVVGTTSGLPLFTPLPFSVDSRLYYTGSEQGFRVSGAVGLGLYPYAFPASGAEIQVRVLLLTGTLNYILFEYSTDGGSSWTPLSNGLLSYTPSGNPFRAGLWYDGDVGAATGVHVGNLRVGTISEF